jgi:NTP pyrophosphatase (non-canonical NTP hydrolase)
MKENVMRFNQLSDAELERLAYLSEELGEVQQMIGKILRFGYESWHPDYPSVTNREDLAKEIGHVEKAVSLLILNNDIDNGIVMESSVRKDLNKYMLHQERI